MNKLDERIELAKEELNKKITDTKKSIVKKLEQEVVVVNQQIREVDERCRQTENEVLEVREVINKEITQVKEHQRTKLEENKIFALEEINKVRTHVTERCDGVEAAMTNITGQVRQSQEEIEIIRNRPTGYNHFPMSENREWLNFRQYKRKPMEFLARIEAVSYTHLICFIVIKISVCTLLVSSWTILLLLL